MCGGCHDYPRRTEEVNHPLIPNIAVARLERFFNGQYATQDIDGQQDLARYDSSSHVKMTRWSTPAHVKPTVEEGFKQLADGQGEPLEKGYKFGPSWSNHWVKVELTIPDEVKGLDQQVIFEFDPGSEGLVFSTDGTPLHGLCGGPNTDRDGQPGMQDDRRIEHIIPPSAVKSGQYTFIIEVSCNGMFGNPTNEYRYQLPDPNRLFPLVAADIVVPNMAVRDLRMDFKILTQVVEHGDKVDPALAARALKACDDVMNAWRRYDDAEKQKEVVKKCRGIMSKVLGQVAESELCVNKRSADGEKAQLWAIGHCHIDTAWLWRYSQTQQKVARSWTTQCDLMDRWPNHQFAASSAQQYLWLEQLYPSGFERVKRYVEEGRFHVVGGAWLEHDCMIPSGESLCRQYLYGQQYFKSRFGSVCREAWLPDTFGYASQLPQILRLAGLKYFFTQKLSWNNINIFPYSTFNWSGIDGTQVLAHMTPVDSYNSQCDYPELLKGARDHKNLAVTDQSLLLFGNGDGGGGPTPRMLEKLERLSSLSKTNPTVPSLRMGGPSDFFDDLLARTEGGKVLPTWRGELYFEYHRGTYTTQANSKKGNLELETVLRDLEYFATLASLYDEKYSYPKKELEEIWHDLLLTQFHDCIPGTTIKMVVEDNLEIYSNRIRQAQQLISAAFASLQTAQSASSDKSIVDPLRLSRNHVYRADGGALAWLKTDGRGQGDLSSSPSGLKSPFAEAKADRYTVKNERFSVIISAGRISSIVDLELGRELIVPGPGSSTGGLVLFEDYPLRYDAWDVEIYHLQSPEEVFFDEVKVVNESLRSSLVASVKFGKSTARLTISLDAVDPNDATSGRDIHCDLHINWQETHRIIKFALPVDIHHPHATYATQFGLVTRPTHRNTTHDAAKFEVCAHGFADLSEAGYGVALAGEAKYGYAVEGNTMRVSLLKSSMTPDPDADKGVHDIQLQILPHRGDITQARVLQRVKRLHSRVYAVDKPFPSSIPEFTLKDSEWSDGIVLETVKRGEDDEADGKRSIVLRLYESNGGRARGSFISAMWMFQLPSG